MTGTENFRHLGRSPTLGCLVIFLNKTFSFSRKNIDNLDHFMQQRPEFRTNTDSLHMSQAAHQARAYAGLCSIR